MVCGALIVAAYLILDALGAGVHASVVAGMPQNAASWVIGPVYVIARLGAVIVSPILLLGSVLRLVNRGLRRPSPARHLEVHPVQRPRDPHRTQA